MKVEWSRGDCPGAKPEKLVFENGRVNLRVDILLTVASQDEL